MSTLKCPKCGKSDQLRRVEMMYVHYEVKPDDCGRGGDTGAVEDIGESAGRLDHMKDEPEFHCKNCSLDFDWSPETGGTWRISMSEKKMCRKCRYKHLPAMAMPCGVCDKSKLDKFRPMPELVKEETDEDVCEAGEEGEGAVLGD